jgi:hypothetical protein
MKTRAEVAELMEKVFGELRATREAGQKEYAHKEENAFRNFEQTGADLDIPREKVLYIFAKKHWDGIMAYINGHQSQREDVRGRIKDVIVYLILLWAMIDDREESRGQKRKAVGEQGAGSEGQGEGQGDEGPQGRQEGSEAGPRAAPISGDGQVHRRQ